jgi:hypothetical protein
MSKRNARENFQRLAAFWPKVISPMEAMKRTKKTGKERSVRCKNAAGTLNKKI